MLWKVPLGYGILTSRSPHGYWNFPVLSVSLKYMTLTKVNEAVDLQIQVGRMAVFENIFESHTHMFKRLYPFDKKCLNDLQKLT